MFYLIIFCLRFHQSWPHTKEKNVIHAFIYISDMEVNEEKTKIDCSSKKQFKNIN